MKQFEKWLKKFYKNHQGVMRYRPTVEQGWEEALKMLSNRLKRETEPPNCRCFQTVQDIIKEELEDETEKV